jgi:hypothetical protein
VPVIATLPGKLTFSEEHPMSGRKLRFFLLAGAAFVLAACAGDYLPASPYYAAYTPSVPLYSNAALPGYSDTIVPSDGDSAVPSYSGSTAPSYSGSTGLGSYSGATTPSYNAATPTYLAPPGYTVEPPYLGYRFNNGAYYGWRNPASVPMHHFGGVPHSNNLHPVGGPLHFGGFHPGGSAHVGEMNGGGMHIGGGHRG